MVARHGRWTNLKETKVRLMCSYMYDMLAGQNHQQRSNGEGRDRKRRRICQKEKMEVHRTHYEERIWQWLEDCNDAGSRRAPQAERPRKAWRRTAEKERERAELRSSSWREVSTHQLTELVGDIVSRPHLSLGEKRLGEGWVIIQK